MNNYFRPPAVPLITMDPYCNIWSFADRLYDDMTRHWTGKSQGMTGMLSVDGRTYRFMGAMGEDAPVPMEQTGLSVTPLSTVYTFTASGVELALKFTTPLLPDDLYILSRPVSYVTFAVRSVDGAEHAVKLYFDVSSELCTDQPGEEIVCGWADGQGSGTAADSRWSKQSGRMAGQAGGRLDMEEQYAALYMGTRSQPVLQRCGDDVRIDWGYVYLAVPSDMKKRLQGAALHTGRTAMRREFARKGELGDIMPDEARSAARDRSSEEGGIPALAACLDFGSVDAEEKQCFLAVAYDDIFSVEYFGSRLKGYWTRDGKSFEQVLSEAVSDYGPVMKRCDEFDTQLMGAAEEAGGRKYADILGLAYRQAVAAHKLVADENGEALFFSKECFSNGCMGTVDVSYPSVPLFLLYNPELVKGMLRGVFRFSRLPVWEYDFAPHDIGRYPHANGQVYGVSGRPENTKVFDPPLYTLPARQDTYLLDRQMPVEECGNMLIMTAAVCRAERNAAFAEENMDLLAGWTNYLIRYGMDPGHQLCTDDFAGHLAHNANLSIKAIMGIASYAVLCEMLGRQEEAGQHFSTAREMAQKWVKLAREGDHYRLAFDSPGSWSMKYNLVWDLLFHTNIFPSEIIRQELACYLRKQNRYGLPLDNRDTYTKSDWLLWCASMADNREDFEKLVAPLWDFLKDTPCRVPFTDWYDTVTGRQVRCICHEGKRGFRNRTVQGGLFIKLLMDKKLLMGRKLHE